MVYGYYDRAIYAAGFIGVGLGIGIPSLSHASLRLRGAWLLSCLCLTPYPLLPVDGGSQPLLVVAAVVAAVGLALCTDSLFEPRAPSGVFWTQMGCTVVQCITCGYTGPRCSMQSAGAWPVLRCAPPGVGVRASRASGVS